MNKKGKTIGKYRITMPETLKTYINRCRCCLEKFFLDEKISQITNFFEIQFTSFTGGLEVKIEKTLVADICLLTIDSFQLKHSDLLSRHVCEFCHVELLRFSVFKKDLIEVKLKAFLSNFEVIHDES